MESKTQEIATKPKFDLNLVPTWPNQLDRALAIYFSCKRVNLNSDLCRLCHSTSESEDHLFVYCSTNKEIMALIKAWCRKFPFNSSSLTDFLYSGRDENISNKERMWLWILLSRRTVVQSWTFTIRSPLTIRGTGYCHRLWGAVKIFSVG